MESEIREYEDQLEEVQAALELEKSAELEEVENELVSLIAELKKKAPKFPPNSSVIVEGVRPAIVVSVDGMFPHYSYRVKFNEGEALETASAAFSESKLAENLSPTETSNPPAPRPQSPEQDCKQRSMVIVPPNADAPAGAPANMTAGMTASAKTGPPGSSGQRKPDRQKGKPERSDPQPAHDEVVQADNAYEESRSKWKQFSQQKGRKWTPGPAVVRGVSKKPVAARRPHFAK